MGKEDLAMDYFRQGYSCAQAVLLAFCQETGLTREQASMLSAPFGGGMGRLREVCGAVSGMFMVAGALYGYDYNDDEKKKEHYALIQKLAAKFTAEHGTIICRDLLKIASEVPSPIPTKRDAEFYKARPCVRFVETAARLTEELIEDKE